VANQSNVIRTEEEKVRHASRMEGSRQTLCGSEEGRTTRPHESVNCPDCRVVMNHVSRNYRDYFDWRMTAKERRGAADAMYRDLVLGEVND
jgi:hypothetical protein